MMHKISLLCIMLCQQAQSLRHPSSRRVGLVSCSAAAPAHDFREDAFASRLQTAFDDVRDFIVSSEVQRLEKQVQRIVLAVERKPAGTEVDELALGTKVDWSPEAWTGPDAAQRRLAALYAEGYKTVQDRSARKRAYEAAAADDSYTAWGLWSMDQPEYEAIPIHKGKPDWSPTAWKGREQSRLAALYEDGRKTLEARNEKRTAYESFAEGLYAEGWSRVVSLEAASQSVLGAWEVSAGELGTRRVELLPGGAVQVQGNLGERGTYDVESVDEGIVVTVRLHLTSSPAVRATEHVFSGLVDAEECAAQNPSWNMCKLHE